MKIKVWGSRGTRITPGEDMLIYGSNTSCVEVINEGDSIFIDGGSGIIKAGQVLGDNLKKIHIFLSHYHLDHINGLPFFKPLLGRDCNVEIYGKAYKGINVKGVLNNFITPPYTPYTLDDFTKNLKLNNISANEQIFINDLLIETMDNVHPDGGLYFKISSKGKVFSYITDIELVRPYPRDLIEFVKGSDLLLIDSMYTEIEYMGENKKVGWGHSSWERAVEFGMVTKSNKILLFHHSPFRTDAELLSIEEKAREIYKNTLVAKEGMELEL